MKTKHLGIIIETATTSTTAPPGSHGIGGCMITGWIRFASLKTWHNTSWKRYDVSDVLLKFTDKFSLVQYLQYEFKLPLTINPYKK